MKKTHKTTLDYTDEMLKAKEKSYQSWQGLVVLGLKYLEEKRDFNCKANTLEEKIQEQNNKIALLTGIVEKLVKINK